MSSIQSTRRGFLYQDRVATSLFLEYFQNRNIVSFYLDYPLKDQRSIDVRILTTDNLENIYEVKSGENFKLDKRKKPLSEISEALINLREYSKSNQALCWLIVSKGFKPQIAEYWQKLLYAKKSKTLSSPSTKLAVNWLFQKLNTKTNKVFTNHTDLHNFCFQLEISEFADDKYLNGTSDRHPPIDDDIIQKINDLLLVSGSSACGFEYSEDNLLYELFHIFRENAGNGNDIFPKAKSAILNFICHRKYLDSNYSPKGDNENVKNQIKKDVSDWYEKWWQPQRNLKGNKSIT